MLDANDFSDFCWFLHLFSMIGRSLFNRYSRVNKDFAHKYFDYLIGSGVARLFADVIILHAVYLLSQFKLPVM